jgi:PAS domain S-box-containing protein
MEGARDEGRWMGAEAGKLLQSLVEGIQDYAILLLDPQGRVHTWPPAARRLFGWEAEEVLDRHVSALVVRGGFGIDQAEAELDAAARDGRFEDEGWRFGKDGDRFWAHVVVVPLRDAEGGLLGFSKIVQDLTERRQSEERVRSMAHVIESASLPVVPVWPGVVLVPLIGQLDSTRTQLLMESLLQAVTESRSPMAVIDITGVATVDTQTAQHLLETVSAVRLVGADVVMTGIRPGIAQTLVHLGVDLSSIRTCSSLAAGLELALKAIGQRVVPDRGKA